jgi:hypothetical protein
MEKNILVIELKEKLTLWECIFKLDDMVAFAPSVSCACY